MNSRLRHPAFDYFLQFTMTFLGVSLGFMADNLREDWSEERMETTYLVSLREDLIQDTARLNKSIRTKSVKGVQLDSLMMMLTSPDRPQHSGRIHYLLRIASIREPFYGNDGTIRQLESAGGFRLIQNRKIVRLLNDYISLRSMVSDVQQIRDDQSAQLKEAIANIADGKVINDMQDFKLNGNFPYWLRAPSGNPPLISEKPEYISQLVYWISNEDSLESMMAKLHRDLRTSAENLIQEIDMELKNRE